MPRANRHYVPGLVWHITHRCHQRQFLLRFAQDRRCWRHWLFEARRRYGLRVLDYIATSNHIHLLVADSAPGVIARSMQLVAGRTAQAYNRRKQRDGAFWSDRYFAVAVQDDDHLARCVVYIDLNMVRAGAVAHPAEWEVSGYDEIHAGRSRYRIIDQPLLAALCGSASVASYRRQHRERVDATLTTAPGARQPAWTESVAVGSQAFCERVKNLGGPALRYRPIERLDDDGHRLRDTGGSAPP